MDHPSVVELQTQRDSILEQIARFGDFRPGNLAQRHGKLSKPSCHCARPDSIGYGPTWTLTIKTRIQKSVYHAVPEEALFAQHLINFGAVSDQIHKAPLLVQLTARVIQRKFRNTPTSCLALDFACQLPSMVQSAAWGGALPFWIATFSDVWRHRLPGETLRPRRSISPVCCVTTRFVRW